MSEFRVSSLHLLFENSEAMKYFVFSVFFIPFVSSQYSHANNCIRSNVCDPRVDRMQERQLEIIWKNMIEQDKKMNSVPEEHERPIDHPIISSTVIQKTQCSCSHRHNHFPTANLYMGSNDINSGSNIDMMTKIFSEILSHPRSDDFDPALKNKTKEGIIERLSHYTLETQTQEFFAKAPNGTVVQGTNIIGVIPGRKRGSAGDSIVVVGAHYDTDGSTPGVDDNASGVVGLLEVARLLSPKMGNLNHTILLVAFDLEEKGILGSLAFVNNYLIPHELVMKRSKFSGAYIMEQILNYDSSPNSQILPLDIVAGVPESAIWLQLNGNRGDFVSVWSRRVLDWPLWHNFHTQWHRLNPNSNETDVPKLYQLDPPIPRNPLLLSTMRFRGFFRTDHAAFWTYRSNEYNEDLSAVLITDMGSYRGSQRACHHEFCDDKRLLTPDNLDFMKRIVDTVAQAVERLAE